MAHLVGFPGARVQNSKGVGQVVGEARYLDSLASPERIKERYFQSSINPCCKYKLKMYGKVCL